MTTRAYTNIQTSKNIRLCCTGFLCWYLWAATEIKTNRNKSVDGSDNPVFSIWHLKRNLVCSHWINSCVRVCVCVCVCYSLNHIWLFAIPRTVAHQGPLWNSPGKKTGVGSHSLLQGIFPIQGSNLGLLHCRQILYCLNHQGSLNKLYSQTIQ